MSDRINLEQQRKRAKDLRRGYQQGQIDAAVRIARYLPRARNQSPGQILGAAFTLSEAQFVIAREAGFSSWPRMKHHIEEAMLSEADIANRFIEGALGGNEAVVRSVLARDPDLPHRSLYVAVVRVDEEAALAALDADPALANRKGGTRDWPPLLYLCSSRYRRDDTNAAAARIRIAGRLIELGADVNAEGLEPGYGSWNVTLFDQQAWRPIDSAAWCLPIPGLIRLLLDSGADVKKTGALLSQAVRGGNPEVLQVLMDAMPPEWQVRWALKACAVLDRKDLARVLMRQVAPPNVPNEQALLEAIQLERELELIEILTGPPGNDAFRSIWTRAHRTALRYAQREAANLLRQRGVDDTAVTDLDRVIAACMAGNRAEMKRLISQPSFAAVVLQADDHQMLAWAVRTRRFHAVPLLLEAGFDPDVPAKDGETPLHLAAMGNSAETAAALLRAGASVDKRNFEAKTPLDVAVTLNHEEMIQLFLAAGANPAAEETSLERDEMNALFERAADAVVFGETKALRDLLDEEPALIHARSPRPHRATLLNYCGANGVEAPRQRTPANAAEILQLLIDRGADVNATCNLYGGGATTLGLLISSVFPIRAGLSRPLMEILVNAGAVFDGKSGAEGITGAAALGRFDLVANFFEASGALKPNVAQPQVQIALVWACTYGRTPVVDFLLDHGAAIARPVQNQMTALHLAAFSGYLETVQLLLRRGAPLELENAWGGTVLNSTLHAAVHHDPYMDYVPVVEALIQAGAKIYPETVAWWDEQEPLVPSAKQRIRDLLRRLPPIVG